jgi:DNA ligase-1
VQLKLLADAFTRLERSSGRGNAVAIVADLFARASTDEIEAVVALLQGRLRPPYEGVEVGLGERLLMAAIAMAYGTQPAVVRRRFRQLGDLGLVAEALATVRPRRGISVRAAYTALLDIARVSGTKSVERKTALLAALLWRVTSVEAKYLVRIIQGRLRLGVGEQTILEAAAVGALGDRRQKDLVEHAYNVRSDLGAVVRAAYSGGVRALARMGPRVGTPVRPALAQRLPSAEAIIERLGTVEVEPKYDGFRLQLHRDGARVWMFSRRLESVGEMFPELAVALRRQLKARRVIIEGEAVGYDPKTGHFLPFQVTMTRKRKIATAEAADRHPLRLFAFDLLYANRRSFIPVPQRERHERLVGLVRGGPRDPIVVTDVRETSRTRELEAYFRAMLRRGLEGIIAKRPDAPYRAGARRYDWVKLKRAYQSKLRDTVDVVLVGYLMGRGRRAALGIGSLLAAVYEPRTGRFRTVAKIGSGPSEQGWKTLRRLLDTQRSRSKPAMVDSIITPDVWVEPRHVVAVLADEITRSPLHTAGKVGDAPGYALRFPRMLDGVRADKGPEDATTEQEILELYRMQGRSGARQAAAPARTARRRTGPTRG